MDLAASIQLVTEEIVIKLSKSLRKETGILIIEDCAEALGTRYKGKHVGINSDAAIFSFFGNKLITTG